MELDLKTIFGQRSNQDQKPYQKLATEGIEL
jgi:hypothetical protein